MAVRVAEFQKKIESFFYKNQRTKRKGSNFEFRINGKLSKIEHHFSDKVI